MEQSLSSSDESDSNVSNSSDCSLIQVDFDFEPLSETDFHSIKFYVEKLSLNPITNLSLLTEKIIENGSGIKVGDELVAFASVCEPIEPDSKDSEWLIHERMLNLPIKCVPELLERIHLKKKYFLIICSIYKFTNKNEICFFKPEEEILEPLASKKWQWWDSKQNPESKKVFTKKGFITGKLMYRIRSKKLPIYLEKIRKNCS